MIEDLQQVQDSCQISIMSKLRETYDYCTESSFKCFIIYQLISKSYCRKMGRTQINRTADAANVADATDAAIHPTFYPVFSDCI